MRAATAGVVGWAVGVVGWSVAAALSGAAGCQSTSEQTAAQTMRDTSVSTAVQMKLTGDRTSNFARVDVDAEQGIVTLSGVVPSPAQKARAEALTRQVEGVTGVHNQLHIEGEQGEQNTAGPRHE